MTDPSSIIRQVPEHSVTVTDGSLVATSRPSDPNAPQVRQNLAGEKAPEGADPESAEPGLPARIAPTPVADAPVFERVALAPPQELHLPDPLTKSEPSAQAPVFERSIQDAQGQAVVPPALTPATPDEDSAVDRFLRERRLATQAQDPSGDEPAGPVIDRSIQDRFVPTPEGIVARKNADDGLVFEHSLQDRSIEVDLPGRMASESAEAIIPAVPREGSSPSVPPPLQARTQAPEQMPLQQAQQILTETAQEVTDRVQAAIGQADGEWAEMDFPARVVKLKIENDKVCTRLDELEELADKSRR